MDLSDVDYVYHVEDEIALEGLDGITLEGLWKRLNLRNNFTNHLNLTDESKEFLWSLIVENEEILFFCLEEPRSPLIIFNRYKYIDKKTGDVYDPVEDIEDVYPISPVEDIKAGIRGSCSTYETRKNVTDDVIRLSLREIMEKYNNKLVMVASQALRNRCLGISSTIDKFNDLQLMHYLILERIGRSRSLGEITFGKNSLFKLNISSNTLYHYMKILISLKLIKKQYHLHRSSKMTLNSSRLYHLSRFFIHRRMMAGKIIDKIIELLYQVPDHQLPVKEVVKEIGCTFDRFKHLVRKLEFGKKLEVKNMTYRQVYPNADEADWRSKKTKREKILRCVKFKDEISDPLKILDDSEDEEAEEEESSYILDRSKLMHRKSLQSQGYRLIEDAGHDGMSQSEFGRAFGFNKLDARVMLRKLARRGFVRTIMSDRVKRREQRYIALKFFNDQEYQKEKENILKIVNNPPSHDDNQEKKASPISSTVTDIDWSKVLIEIEVSQFGKTSYARVVEPHSESDLVYEIIERDAEEQVASQSKDAKTSSSIGFHRNHVFKKRSFKDEFEEGTFTTKVMKRVNIIMNEVRRLKVIENISCLCIRIREKEAKDGLQSCMDRKTLLRSLQNLASAGFLKKIALKFSYNDQEEECVLIADSNVDLESDVLKSAIQFKKQTVVPKLFFASENKFKYVPNDTSREKTKDLSPSLRRSVDEVKEFHTMRFVFSPPIKSSPNKAVYQPLKKYSRTMELHRFLFYLTYGYEGIADLNQEEAWQCVIGSANRFPEESYKHYPKMYQKSNSMTMFVPALPQHSDYPRGFIFVADVILRIPLSLFVRICKVNRQAEMFSEFMNHSIKRNMLLKDLPGELRTSMIENRRYLVSLSNLFCNLCFMGLLQYGRAFDKDFDQQFVYINRKASIVDTTISDPGYLAISSNKNYVKKEYKFETAFDIYKYWDDLCTICLHTPLGGTSSKSKRGHSLSTGHMAEAASRRGFEEAVQRDDGTIPGYGKGAGGLDSALFSHKSSSWSYKITSLNETKLGLQDESSTSKSLSEESMHKYAQYLQGTSYLTSGDTKGMVGVKNVRLSLYQPKSNDVGGRPLPVSVGVVDVSKARRRFRKPKSLPSKGKMLTRSSTSKRESKRLLKRASKKPVYDDVDRSALRRMDKLRVGWNICEDSYLLLCKVAFAYMVPRKNKMVVDYLFMRDFLHEHLPESLNKTTRACQRRVNYMFKREAAHEHLAVLLGEIKQDKEITSEFKPIKLSVKSNHIMGTYSDLIKKLVEKLILKYGNSKSMNVISIPDTYEEFLSKFDIVKCAEYRLDNFDIKPIVSLTDIDHYVVNTLIFSSLCSKQDRESYAYQLYLVYQHYSQNLLCDVLLTVRSSRMVSYRKSCNRSKFARSCLPLTASPFQLSVNYARMFRCKYSFTIFSNCWDMMKSLVSEATPLIALSIKRQLESDRCSSDTTDTCPVDFEAEDSTPKSVKRKKKKVPFKYTIKRKKKPDKAAETEFNQVENSEDLDLNSIGGMSLPNVINGGVASCIFALLATKRISLSLSLPDQIFKMDNVPNKTGFSEPSGSVSTDISAMALEKDSTMDEDLFGSNEETHEKVSSHVDLNLPETVVDSGHETDFVAIPGTSNSLKRKSEDEFDNVENSKKRKPEEETIAEENVADIDDANKDVFRGSMHSKSRLFMMREQADYASTIHSSELINLNPCKFTCKLKTPEELKTANPGSNEQISEALMPVSSERIHAALSERKKVVLDISMNIEQSLVEWRSEGCDESFVAFAEKVYLFIQSKKDFGASARDIKTEFKPEHCFPYHPMMIVRRMEENNCVWRVGMESLRWVTIPYAKRWLILTNKISRSKIKCAESVVRISGLYEVKNVEKQPEKSGEPDNQDLPTNSESKSEDDIEEIESLGDKEELCSEDGKELGSEDGNEEFGSEFNKESGLEEPIQDSLQNTQETPVSTFDERNPSSEAQNIRNYRALSKPAYRKDTDDIEQQEKAIKKNQENSQFEQIELSVRPWVRLNGCLNRRVLDRMLGAVLYYVMENPVISQKQITDKFWPALQPAHTTELLHTLVTLDAVRRYYVKLSHKATLFSKPQNIELERAMDYDDDDSLVYEAEADCVLKLAAFIGDKKYTQDFLTNINQ